MILLVLPSCKCLDTATQLSTINSQLSTDTRDSVVLRDSVLVRDSTFTSEHQRGDTIYRERIVYRDRTQWRDRWRTRLVHDTIRDTQYITQTIEHPPRKYVPKFYKWCTGLLWAFIAIAIVVAVWRLRL